MRPAINTIAQIVGGHDPVGALRIVVAVRVDGLTQQQVAQREGISQSAVAQRLARVRRIVAGLGLTEGAFVDMLRKSHAA